jgi:HlyD family secretion protein
MVDQKSHLFRKESLERLSSPERLDQLMQVVSPKSWLPLVSLGSLIVVGLLWSIYGRIPITVEGKGVLIYPRKVLALQSKTSGQLVALNVKVGDYVNEGDVLATVNQIELNKQLQLARNKLAQLQGQDRDVNSLQARRNALTEKTLQRQRQYLQQNLETTMALTPVLREKSIVSLQAERQTQVVRLQTTEGLLPILKDRWDARQYIYEQGAVSKDQVLQAQREYQESRAQSEDVKAQLKRLESQEAQAQREYLNNLNSITDIQAKLRELDSQEANLRQQDLEAATNRQKEIQDVEREIAKLQQQLGDNSQIVSPYSGRILELAVNPGQVVDQGIRLGSMDVQDPSSQMVGITYFSVADGKKIQPGMALQITPETVKRERFGGILAKVTNISAFPITKEAAASVVGNPEVVQGLVTDQQPGLIQVYGGLQKDSGTFSGYKWSASKGPRMKMSPGTTTTVRVKVEERAPITFLLPILRSTSGIY